MPRTSQTTSTGTPRLSELAKHASAPDGIVSTGWPAVERTCTQKLGVTFDPWQAQAGRLILAKRDDGSLASMIDGVGLSLPRQVGKTYLISAMVFALCINTPGLLVIWTAHHLKTTNETFQALQGFAARQRVAPFVKFVHTGSSDQEIAFHNGSRILFGARERGFGRGIPGVDVLIFDEAQILTDRAMSDMLATMNTSSFGLALFIGTPPKPSDEGRSETFKRMRRDALAGDLHDGAWIEFGADDDADSDDRAQWRLMNPSYPKRTPAQSLLRLKRKLTDGDWRREGMGIWDADSPGSRLITADEWSETGVLEPPTDGVQSFGVAFSLDGNRVSLAGARRHEEGVHVEVVSAAGPMDSGVAEIADWLAERKETTALIAISGSAGSGPLSLALLERGLSGRMVHVCTTSDYLSACSMFHDAVRDRTFTHWVSEGQEAFDRSVEVCDKKRRGTSGGWSWEATTPDGDETPMEAASVALWASRVTNRRPGRKTRVQVLT